MKVKAEHPEERRSESNSRMPEAALTKILDSIAKATAAGEGSLPSVGASTNADQARKGWILVQLRGHRCREAEGHSKSSSLAST